MKPELMVRRFDILNLKETILIDRRCANGLLRKPTGDDVFPAGYGYDAQRGMTSLTNWLNYLGRCVEKRRAAEDSATYKPLRRGWCLGDKRFRKEPLAEMAGGMGPEHYGEERGETEVEQAEQIVRRELRKAGWDEGKLGSTPKGHAVKVQVAMRLREQATMSHGWIAQRLQMGSRSQRFEPGACKAKV